jgi:methionyl-tRNA formyltransferase
MKIWICAYREWSLEIYNQISKEFDNVELIETKKEFERTISLFQKEDFIFFLGWSWIIPDEVVEDYNCICLHPSPLPKYRGGSPLQHQIINGERNSAVTYFRMTDKLDAGPVLFQKEFSLEGELKDITNRIIPLAIQGIFIILNNKVKEHIQDESKATFFKRRNPKESEIKLDDFKQFSAKELYDKIRSLQDPYPNAFVICKNNKKIFLKVVKYEE